MIKMVTMGNFHYLASAVLFMTWVLGYLVFNAGNEIHFVFLAAVLVIVHKIIKENTDRN